MGSKFIHSILHDSGLDGKLNFDVTHCSLPKPVQGLEVLASNKKDFNWEKKKSQKGSPYCGLKIAE